jgi:hypothetical protein
LSKNKLWWWTDDKKPWDSRPIESPERVLMFEEVCPAVSSPTEKIPCSCTVYTDLYHSNLT